MMQFQSAMQLNKRKCAPCEGGVDQYTREQSLQQLAALEDWELIENGLQIARTWKAKNFKQAMKILNVCAEVAEQEQHHPDFHLTGYRNVRVALTTHAIGGLSENDFILAAKIDAVMKVLGL